jgi:AmmeMemoRadiSam system protein B
MSIRVPAVAGAFYPAAPAALADLVDRLLDAVDIPADDRLAAAYVVPHAGYRYSGPTAAHVYARLRRHADDLRRIVLIGPSHRVPLAGAAVSAADRWRTPLGEVTVDSAGASALADAGLAVVDETPHAPEHSLEVQVPFLQRALLSVAPRDVPILPVCIGRSQVDETRAVIDSAVGVAGAVGGDGTVVLCSTDLSHYLPDHEARARDTRTAQAIVALDPDRIGTRDACGSYALRGLLAWADRLGLVTRLLDLSTSADTAGGTDRVVGYAAFSMSVRMAG